MKDNEPCSWCSTPPPSLYTLCSKCQKRADTTPHTPADNDTIDRSAEAADHAADAQRRGFNTKLFREAQDRMNGDRL